MTVRTAWLGLVVLASCVSTRSAETPAPATATVFAPGVISDEHEQWRITFTADGSTAYFAESAEFFPFTRKATIYVTHRDGGGWTTPAVASFSGTHSDIDPFITPDGRRLYFSSIRPVNGVTRGDIDLWMVERTDGGWSAPARLGDEVNSPGDELYPSASADGTIYFASGPLAPKAGEHFDIFRARRTATGFAMRERLGAGVNRTPTAGDRSLQDSWEFNPEISPDGRTLVFTSLRPGGSGLGDLYVSHLRDGDWTPAVNLGPLVNTAADEFHPTIARDRRTLYFVRRGPPPARGDFRSISTTVLPALTRR